MAVIFPISYFESRNCGENNDFSNRQSTQPSNKPSSFRHSFPVEIVLPFFPLGAVSFLSLPIPPLPPALLPRPARPFDNMFARGLAFAIEITVDSSRIPWWWHMVGREGRGGQEDNHQEKNVKRPKIRLYCQMALSLRLHRGLEIVQTCCCMGCNEWRECSAYPNLSWRRFPSSFSFFGPLPSL